MFNAGFGSGTGDFEGLSRQYWSAWGEAMRQAGVSAGVIPPPQSHWQQAVNWWSQLLPGGPSQANDAVGRFNQQARDWYGQMQQVAAQFAGQRIVVAGGNALGELERAFRIALGELDTADAQVDQRLQAGRLGVLACPVELRGGTIALNAQTLAALDALFSPEAIVGNRYAPQGQREVDTEKYVFEQC